MTPWAAVALGDAGWIQAQRAQGSLFNPVEDTGGLLRVAVSWDRADILQLLLDLGFDPNERTRVDNVDADCIAFTWGMPLYCCAQFGEHEMAEVLLKHGEDPNGKVYASGDPGFQAYSKNDWKMIGLSGAQQKNHRFNFRIQAHSGMFLVLLLSLLCRDQFSQFWPGAFVNLNSMLLILRDRILVLTTVCANLRELPAKTQLELARELGTTIRNYGTR